MMNICGAGREAGKPSVKNTRDSRIKASPGSLSRQGGAIIHNDANKASERVKMAAAGRKAAAWKVEE